MTQWPPGTPPPGVPHPTPSHGADAWCSLPTNTLASMMVGGCGCHGAHPGQVGAGAIGSCRVLCVPHSRCTRRACASTRVGGAGASAWVTPPCMTVSACAMRIGGAGTSPGAGCSPGRGVRGSCRVDGRWFGRSMSSWSTSSQWVGRSMSNWSTSSRWVGQLVSATLGRWCVSA